MLTEKEKKDLKTNERRLQLPKWKYVLLYGVLFWGISVAVAVTIFDLIFSGKSLQMLWKEGLITRFISLPLAGVVVGLGMRFLSNKQYKRLKAKEMAV